MSLKILFEWSDEEVQDKIEACLESENDRIAATEALKNGKMQEMLTDLLYELDSQADLDDYLYKILDEFNPITEE